MKTMLMVAVIAVAGSFVTEKASAKCSQQLQGRMVADTNPPRKINKTSGTAAPVIKNGHK